MMFEYHNDEIRVNPEIEKWEEIRNLKKEGAAFYKHSLLMLYFLYKEDGPFSGMSITGRVKEIERRFFKDNNKVDINKILKNKWVNKLAVTYMQTQGVNETTIAFEHIKTEVYNFITDVRSIDVESGKDAVENLDLADKKYKMLYNAEKLLAMLERFKKTHMENKSKNRAKQVRKRKFES